MKPAFWTSAAHAIQLFAAVAIATLLKPVFVTLLPNVWEPVLVLGLALISAVVIEALSTLLLGKPSVEIVWLEEENPLPVTRLDMSLSSSQPTSLAYSIKVKVHARTALGHAMVARLAKSDAVLSVSFPSSPVKAVVDRAPRDADNVSMVRSNSVNGFDFDLRNGITPRDLWTWAEVRFEAVEFPKTAEVDAIYKKTATSTIRARLSAKVLGVHSDVSQLRFRGP